MRPARPQRGVALLILLAILAIGATWYLVSRISAYRLTQQATVRARNAAVLKTAKEALIGYVASEAAQLNGRNPGRLPCPEPAEWTGVSGAEGIAAPGTQAGISANTCSNIGRLPWRTLGLDKLVDASGEPLWYVVGPTWRLTNSSSTLTINSNTAGDLNVSGSQAVALIVAPGPAMQEQASAGCTARNQSRAAPGSTRDPLDYLECYDAASLTFASSGPSTSFNDQVVVVTVADLMPAIEAAIADRINDQIVPVLKSVYDSGTWGLSSTTRIFPYAASFSNPGTATYQGVAGRTSGLLPFNVTQGCNVTDPRCLPNLIVWSGAPYYAYDAGGYGYIQTQSCWTDASPDEQVCEGEYHENDTYPWMPGMIIQMQVTLANVAMGLRALDTTQLQVYARDNTCAPTCPWIPQTVTQTVTMNNGTVSGQPAGSVTITFGAQLPNIDSMSWGTYADYRIVVTRAVIADHPLLDPSNATTGWFVRNEWYRLLYYATVAGRTAAALPSPSCTTGTDCLSVANVTPADAQRAILILAGRSINGRPRPSGTLADYLEFGNRNGKWERQTVTAVLPSSYVDTGSANAYAVPAAALAAGLPIQFRALNTNTGASTLTTPATGAKNVLNADGSPLAAQQIRANAAVQVVYDGTKFVITKRPFNDRIIVLDSN
jgi:hypothetical protein